MIEHFTQASCPPCASQNPVLQATLNTFSTGGGDYVKVSHQTSWPGTDPMNAAYPTGPAERVSYYNISGVPNTSLNGGAPGGPNSVVTAGSLATAAAETTPYDISVTQTWLDAGTIELDIDIDNVTGSAISDADRIFITMYEAEVNYASAPGSNGETDFYNVMRQMYTTSGATANAEGGSSLPSIAANGNQSYTLTISDIPLSVQDKEQIEFAVYIQNNGSGEMYQAAKSSAAPVSTWMDLAASSASIASSGPCDLSFTPAIEFTNNETGTDVTAIVAEYTLNGGAVVTENWSGTLAGGNSTTITFSATTLNTGSNIVSYNIVSVNGGANWISPSAVFIADELYNKLNANATPAPVMETMENAALEPQTGYSRDLSTAVFDADPSLTSAVFGVLDGPTYNYGSIGGFGTSDRSIRVRFYAITSGTMNLIMQKVNTTDNTLLTFDHAHKQYGTENDAMAIYVSTDCGASWSQEFQAAGSSLSTLPASQTQYNAPAAGDWESNQVDLSAYDNMQDVIIRFEFTSAYGNNLFLDNINVGNLASVNEEGAIAFGIFPNPASDNFTVKLDESSDASIVVMDMKGTQVASYDVAGQSSTSVDVSALASGIYTVLVSTEAGVATKKVVVE